MEEKKILIAILTGKRYINNDIIDKLNSNFQLGVNNLITWIDNTIENIKNNQQENPMLVGEDHLKRRMELEELKETATRLLTTYNGKIRTILGLINTFNKLDIGRNIPDNIINLIKTDLYNGLRQLIEWISDAERRRENTHKSLLDKNILFKENGEDVLEMRNVAHYYKELLKLKKEAIMQLNKP
jgi:hypothetical protein